MGKVLKRAGLRVGFDEWMANVGVVDITKIMRNNYKEEAAAIRELLCPRSQWVDDRTVTKCRDCLKEFLPLLRWKHHCRFCGAVFCSTCAGNIMLGEEI